MIFDTTFSFWFVVFCFWHIVNLIYHLYLTCKITRICTMITKIYLNIYCFENVTTCLITNVNNFIDSIDEIIVFKYSYISKNEKTIAFWNFEIRIFQIIEFYKHIIDFKKQIKNDLLFERAFFEFINEYSKNNNSKLQRKLEWICQVVEILAIIYKKHVFQFSSWHFRKQSFLNAKLNVKVSDF